MTLFGELPTEARDPASARLDEMSTLEMMRVVNAADQTVASAVEQQLPAIAAAVDAIAARLAKGGRLFYIGAGTSGRLGVLDASECAPTYSVPREMVQGVMAGGDAALRFALEDVEDDPAQGAVDLQARAVGEQDVVVGISASGRTPYVVGALAYAQRVGALTVGLCCVPGSAVARTVAVAIVPEAGPEVVAGSTRMKAGTATKMVLNMLSTGAMVRLGLVYGNLMVNVQPTNAKLLDRARRIVMAIAGVDEERAAALLAEGGSVRTAVVMEQFGVGKAEAEARLARWGGHLRRTMEEG